MAKYLKGILGPFTGLIGNIVGATWKGKFVMRSRPVKSSRPPSEAQLMQRASFTLMAEFLNKIRDIITIGFQSYQKGQTPFNAAFKYNIENGISGTYPALNIDYPNIVISKGRLLAPPQITIATTMDARLDFSWSNNADPDSTNGTDKICFLVYNPSKQAFAKARGVALRSALSYNMTLPSMWSEDNVHVGPSLSVPMGR